MPMRSLSAQPLESVAPCCCSNTMNFLTVLVEIYSRICAAERLTHGHLETSPLLV